MRVLFVFVFVASFCCVGCVRCRRSFACAVLCLLRRLFVCGVFVLMCVS